MINRRHFIKSTAMVGAGVLAFRGRAWPFAQSPTNIRKFVVSLPGLTAAGHNEIGQYLPLATKRTMNFAGIPTDFYFEQVRQFSQMMHPDLPGPTTFWGYADLQNPDSKYLGGAIVATRHKPVLLSVANKLPNAPIIPIDPTIMAGTFQGQMKTVGQLPYNRIATHLHGGLTPWFSDGTPYQWYTPSGMHGNSFMNVPGSAAAFPGSLTPPGTGIYYYPMDQSARFVWYHDHAMGITRTNAYCGIASALILTDDFEAGLVHDGLLPDLVGIPLVIQDKGFVAEDILTQDPTWYQAGGGQPGSLWYPHDYEVNTFADGSKNLKGRWDLGSEDGSPPSQGTMPLPTVSIVPEAFFDTILINGGLYPKVSVPPKRVRFRMLNGSQARFYHLNLYPESTFHPGEARVGTAGPVMYQVGTEGGFLPQVAVHTNTTPIPLDLGSDPTGNTAFADGPFNLLLAPAERADVVIDFNDVDPGTSFILYSDAPGPFPSGDPRNDYYTDDPDQTAFGGAPPTEQGYGPNTRTLLQITVTSGTGDSLSTASWLNQMNNALASNFGGNQPALLYNNGNPSQMGPLPYTGVVNRKLTLNEDFDEFGRLIQLLGTFTQNGTNNQGLPTWGRSYESAPTETPSAGSTEVWQIMNLTGDTHPIHFHLVNVQLIQRQAFTGDPSNITLLGAITGPDANEMGWKDTVRMNPGEITTVIMKFDLPNLPTAAMRNAVSPRTGGKEYVWHCHILEHEEHDMMRPLIVK
jgi:spore coat protein A, manganese oxidase